MKRITSLLLALLMTVSVLFAMPVTGLAAKSNIKKSGDFLYSVNSNNEVIIESCTNYDSRKIVVPSKIDGKKVVELAKRTFDSNNTVEEIYINSGVKKINTYVFNSCLNLKSIYIPDSVTYLESHPFNRCNSLTDLRLSKNLEYLGYSVFSYAPTLKTYSDGNGGTYFDNYLISISDKVSEYKVKDGTTLIADSARPGAGTGHNYTLIKLSFPKSLKYISKEAFSECRYLETVEFNEGLKYIGDNAFDECPRLKNVTIPKSVTKIGKNAFGRFTTNEVEVKLQKYVRIKNFVINGYSNSAAQKFAKNNNLKFSTNALSEPNVKITAGKNQIKVNYTKSGSVTGFEVKYTKGKKSTTKTFKTTKSAAKTINKLSKGKYKVQVRTYHTSGSKKAYSPWTDAKTINVK